MSNEDQPANIADDVVKLLDNGWRVELFKNQLGSYTARAVKRSRDEQGMVETFTKKVVDTDDFTPSKSLYRITEKAITGRIV